MIGDFRLKCGNMRLWILSEIYFTCLALKLFWYGTRGHQLITWHQKGEAPHYCWAGIGFLIFHQASTGIYLTRKNKGASLLLSRWLYHEDVTLFASGMWCKSSLLDHLWHYFSGEGEGHLALPGRTGNFSSYEIFLPTLGRMGGWLKNVIIHEEGGSLGFST